MSEITGDRENRKRNNFDKATFWRFNYVFITLCVSWWSSLDSYHIEAEKNGRHITDILKCILSNENAWILIKISLKFVPMGPINNIPTLVQVMAWRRPGDKPSSEPMMFRLPTHICVTRPQRVNSQLRGILRLLTEKTSKLLITRCSYPLWVDCIDDLWIPLTKGQ